MLGRRLRRHAEKGVTLIELAVVMAIVARERHSSANVRGERGQGIGMAIFVTFGAKLGYTLSAVYAMQCEGGILPCKIKVLERHGQRNFWHPKCNLTSEVQSREM
jgi:prepilin-type N-terminal cleavage/methylation domain-containing protein